MAADAAPCTAAAGRSPHVVMATIPMLGHIHPLLRFAKALVSRLQFTVTFVNNRYYHHYILAQEAPPCMSSSSSSSFNGKLRFEWVEDGLPVDYDYSDVLPRQEEFLRGCMNMQAPLKALMESLNQKDPPVSCLIFGSFFTWGHQAAKELGIPSVFFWSQSATVFSIYLHMPLLAANGFFPSKKKAPSDCKEDDAQLASYIPGVPPLHPEECPTFLVVEDTSNANLKMMERQFDVLKECNTVVINSFYDLETEAFEALQEESLSVFAVGPLLSSSQAWEGSENVERDKCLKWLDRQSMHSVLYISSGTLSNPAPEDIKGIALAMREMKQPFVWAIRLRSFYNDALDIRTEYRSVAEMLPENFLEDTRQYGIIVSWAPQQEVLGHPSVGAFLTHCGWNSTLESLSMGVPMIPLPRLSDQTTNSKFVIDVWKVGMRLKSTCESGSVDSADLMRILGVMLHEEEGQEMRRRAGKLKEAARRAIEAGSHMNMYRFSQAFMFHSISESLHKTLSGA